MAAEDIPSFFTAVDWKEKRQAYTWLIFKNNHFGCKLCQEVKSVKSAAINSASDKSRHRDVNIKWAFVKIAIPDESNDKKSLLRTKIRRHKISDAHSQAERTLQNAKENQIQESLLKLNSYANESTEHLLRTAYFCAKSDRPYTDFEHIVELQKFNKTSVGITLHSRATAVEMISSIAEQMKQIIVEKIITNNYKIVVLVDESTSLSKMSCIVVFIRTVVVDQGPPIFILLEIAELVNKTADGIVEVILAVLQKAGFSHEWLQENFIGFVSDGASVLLGKKNGVAVQLKRKYPDLFTLHCMNHRLELAVTDSAKEISGVKNFTTFLGAVYTVYSMSSKNVYELNDICKELGIMMKAIGKVFDVRWVASSLRTIKAVWMNYEALYIHFGTAAKDEKRLPKIRAKYIGLRNHLRSTNFVLNIAILYDVLEELSALSLRLQHRGSDILLADRDIQTTIRYLKSMKENKDVHFTEAETAVAQKCFKNVSLSDWKKVPLINANQLIESLVVNLSNRLLESSEELKDILECSKVLSPENWPKNQKQEVSIRHGQKEIVKLCNKFKCDSKQAVAGMRDYIVSPTSLPKSLQPLKNCLNSLACGTAECERGFSAMNLIVTRLRTLLTIKNLNYLLFIKINGPPVSQFNPKRFIKKWLLHHRHANDNQTRKVEEKNYDADKADLFEMLS